MKHLFACLLTLFVLSASAQSFQWADHIDGYADITNVESIDVDIKGNTYFTGYSIYTSSPESTTITTSFATASFVCGGQEYGFIGSIADDGSLNWFVPFVGMPADESHGYDVEVDYPHKCVYVCGHYTGRVDFDPTVAVEYPSGFIGNEDGFLAKYTLAGGLVWVIRIGGNYWSYLNDLAHDDEGNVFTVGVFNGTVDFDPGFFVHSETSVGDINNHDGFIAKYAPNSSFMWVSVISPVSPPFR